MNDDLIQETDRRLARCPLCRRTVSAFGGRMTGHSTGYGTPDRLLISCMAGGLTVAEAEDLDDRLRKAAHP